MSDIKNLSIEEVIDNFDLFDEWEDKYTYLMDLGKKLPNFPEEQRIDQNKVQGCQAEVWVLMNRDPKNPETLELFGDSNSTIVKGLVAVVVLLFSGKTPSDISCINEKETFEKLGLDQYLSPTRKVGLASMVEMIKRVSQNVA